MAPHSPLILLLLLIVACVTDPRVSAQSPPGFLSIDVGSTETANYTDPTTGIVWTPDTILWPQLADWSTTSTLGPPSSDFADQKQYQSFRYFKTPLKSSRSPSPTKFCYSLPAQSNKYYLIRVSFWCSTNLASASTRVGGALSFYIIIDSYVGPRIDILLPQTSAYVEEYYVQALEGSTSVNLCFSAESEVSDAPFVNSIELRPLVDTLTAIKVLNSSNSALRGPIRYDLGAADKSPPIIRFPNDSLDRFWFTSTTGPTNVTSNTVDMSGMSDVVPMVVMQSNVMANTTVGLVYNFSLPGKHLYYINLFFVELDPQITFGRVFDVSLNGEPTVQNVDVFNRTSGRYNWYTIYTPSAFGPYVDYVLITLTPSPSSIYLPFLSALEVMQVFDNPMVVSTSSNDKLGIEGITTTLSNMSIFKGDPCLPLDYKYSWIGCDDNTSPPRVTSISLSNYNLTGGFPSSIDNLDEIVQILLDGNALEGPVPDLSNLLSLEVLNLSKNQLSGQIPTSLGKLTKLKYLDLSHNNFSGVIPTTLQQNEGLVFKYEGNNFLCLTTNASCSSSTPVSSKTKNHTPLIIGIVCGVLVVLILIIVACICMWKRRQTSQPSTSHEKTTQLNTTKIDYIDHVVSHTKVLEATNVAQRFSFDDIRIATNNFTTILGKGGFGIVYKGILTNGVVVAVKVLSNASHQGVEEFLNEVTLLSRVHHKNLVELVGYCIDNKLMLVYEFMSEGSLFDALFGSTRTTSLKWRERLQILLDAAQGLAYLHTGCNSLIIHRDVKSSNILLTKRLEGKMSDFGISRLQANGDEFTTRLIGSMGYLDPEYASTLRLTEKVDVYSFGVVLFEAMCGQLPLIRDTKTRNTDIQISQWVKPYYEQGEIEKIVDKRLGNEYNVSSIWKVAEIAMACVQYEGSTRPTMNIVSNELLDAIRLESGYVGVSPATTREFFSSTEVQAR